MLGDVGLSLEMLVRASDFIVNASFAYVEVAIQKPEARTCQYDVGELFGFSMMILGSGFEGDELQ